MNILALTKTEREDIAEILRRRANEIAGYSGENREKIPGSVDLALDREIKRLRRFADALTSEATF